MEYTHLLLLHLLFSPFSARTIPSSFSEQKDTSDRQFLVQELQTVGRNVDEGLARLEDVASRERVQAKKAHWHSLSPKK